MTHLHPNSLWPSSCFHGSCRTGTRIFLVKMTCRSPSCPPAVRVVNARRPGSSHLTLGLQIPSKKVRSWGVFRRLNTFLEGIWSPREAKTPLFFRLKTLKTTDFWNPRDDIPKSQGLQQTFQSTVLHRSDIRPSPSKPCHRTARAHRQRGIENAQHLVCSKRPGISITLRILRVQVPPEKG